jgi:hypothetical protein
MGLSQKASNFLADVLSSFDPRVQIGVFHRRTTSDVEFGSDYDATGVKRLASKIRHIAKDTKLSTYCEMPRLHRGGDSGGFSPVHLSSPDAQRAAALVHGLSSAQL